MENDIVFIGSFVEDEISTDFIKISQAGNKFQNKFINFIDPFFSISIAPIFIRKKNHFNDSNSIHFINNFLISRNFVFDFYKLIFDTIDVFLLIFRSKSNNIFFYNVDKQNILIIILLLLFKKNVYLIIADYINYEENYINKFFNLIISSVSGIITLSNIKQIKNNNILQLNGLVESNSLINLGNKKISRNVILSGSLGKTTGFELALETFSMNNEFNLYITGRPFRYTKNEFNKLINKYVQNNKNIHYMGLLDYQNYLNVLSSCDIALCLRKPDDIEHQYNFPSKILEYFSKSKLVVSTMKYNTLNNDSYFYSEFNTKSLIETLDLIISLPQSEIKTRRNNIYNFVKSNFTEIPVKKIVSDLIKKA